MPVHDGNWNECEVRAAPLVNDLAIGNAPIFGVIARNGYRAPRIPAPHGSPAGTRRT
ncbi:hypothetical protein ACIBF5_22185 [Micromonospora sp. NPDC050417]|uniref:hypothetical protein n=1 Tax=Micromonospora sp. NPDC050417 TaxID=3364280 RepID=UPI00379D9865